MTTPEIDALIQPLEQYVTPDQKAELEKILSIGKRWKAQGEQKKQEFRATNTRKYFTDQILIYPEKKEIREEENIEELNKIGYYKMNLIEKNKFEKEFIRNIILYSYHPNIAAKALKKIEALDDFKNSGLEEGMKIQFGDREYGDKLVKIFLEKLDKYHGLKEGIWFGFGCNRILDEGMKQISNKIAKLSSIGVGTYLDFAANEIGDDGLIYFAQALEKIGGLEEGIDINFHWNEIGDEGLIYFAQVLEKIGGLKKGVILGFGQNQIGDEGAIAIAQALEKTGGLKAGSKLNLVSNQIGEDGKAALQKLQDDADAKGIKCTIEF